MSTVTGSIDGSGTASALGDLAFANPTDGADLTASGFVASWVDSGVGNAGYAPYYEVVIAGAGATSDSAFYIGTDRQWTVLNPQGATLAPGDYTANLIGFAGAFTGGQSGISVSNNITGVGVTGSSTASAATRRRCRSSSTEQRRSLPPPPHRSRRGCGLSTSGERE